jgi:hypothetical protein
MSGGLQHSCATPQEKHPLKLLLGNWSPAKDYRQSSRKSLFVLPVKHRNTVEYWQCISIHENGSGTGGGSSIALEGSEWVLEKA